MLAKDNSTAIGNLSALVDFSNLINSSLDLEFALNNILLTCFGKFHTTKGLIALTDNSGYVSASASKGISKEVIDSFPKLNEDNLKNESVELNEFMSKNNLEIKRIIETSSGILGIIILGKRFTKQPYSDEDLDFLKTITNIGSTAIENSLAVDKLRKVNRDLDAKVNQLSSLFDLSKEFSGILSKERITKLLTYSIIGQLLVTKYAIIYCDDHNYDILESKFDEEKLTSLFQKNNCATISEPLFGDNLNNNYSGLTETGVEIVVPMLIKGKTKGLILVGRRRNLQPFTKSDIEFVSSVGGLAIISIENASLFEETLEKQRLEKDLEIARNIQRNLLPDKIPNLNYAEIAAYNQSARQVGGDYYDVIKLDDKRTVVAIADVSGKGVQAALLMANLQAFLRAISKQNIDISEASNLINDLVSENTMGGSFITFFWGILDEDKKSFKYVNAGHNPPLHISQGKMAKLKTGGMIFGVMETLIPYKSETVSLSSGDSIILFTDGITEAMDVTKTEYSDERLEELVLTKCKNSAQEIINSVVDDVKLHTKGANQSDDITSLVIKIK
ncbi:MAG: SpoIIE family protein phosphatase [Melioribacteraceae bacterium]|nr:SpoIIE family protein phosphatase [Melioribacteraceae bacterium]MCF8265682.1 SpoIIE family protein phosphatase [Melioribacteraceae bacterium]MCF8411840.1 SpoIIE family protein phosphatase [Melioribacteraceae bacterium]MCF8431805.1 SpoIIE family protein phosphatase [Melioribacteraceae bacterium]